MKRKTVYLVQGAFIATIYAAFTYFFEPISFSSTQFRISEALTILPALTPAAIPGLTIGCIISNLTSPYGAVDIICGSLATFLAGVCSFYSRKIKFKGLPVLSAAFPVIFNSVIVSAEISVLTTGRFSVSLFLMSLISVGFGELVMCFLCGLPLYSALSKTKIFEKD